MCTLLVNCLEDKAWPVKVWLSKPTMLNKTELGWLGSKIKTQTWLLKVADGANIDIILFFFVV